MNTKQVMDKVRFSSQELMRKQPENNQKQTRSQTSAQQQPPENQPVNNNTLSRRQSETLETSTGTLAGSGAPTGISEYTDIFLYKHMHTMRLPHEIIYVWISDVIVAVILYIECMHTVSSTRLDETVAALGSSNI